MSFIIVLSFFPSLSVCLSVFLILTDPSEVLSADPVDLQCIPMETYICPVPKLFVAAPMTLSPVSLNRNSS